MSGTEIYHGVGKVIRAALRPPIHPALFSGDGKNRPLQGPTESSPK
jgi:hypothetical protein